MPAEIVIPDALADCGPTLRAHAMRIDSELDSLMALLAPLRDSWVGTAGVGWESYQLRFDNAARDLMGTPGTLGQLGNCASVNWDNNVNCEQANTRTWSH